MTLYQLDLRTLRYSQRNIIDNVSIYFYVGKKKQLEFGVNVVLRKTNLAIMTQFFDTIRAQSREEEGKGRDREQLNVRLNDKLHRKRS